MEYIGFVFGIFGLMAYLQISPLKKRVSELEEQLSKFNGTSYSEHRKSLRKIASDLIGKDVKIELKEDDQDIDITMYGNTKYGSNTIMDVDEEWLLVRIQSKNRDIEKLIRLNSITKISLK